MAISLTKSDLGKYAQLLKADHHEIVADARTEPDFDTGFSPHDLYDSALAACKAITLMMYAETAHIPLDDVKVTIDRDSREESSGKYRLHVTLTLVGQLDDSQRERLEKVAGKCPVHKLMTLAETSVTTTCN